MNYEASTHLSDTKFKRLIGVERTVFNEMLACLEQAQATMHQKGGRKLKIGMPNLLMATLQYFKEGCSFILCGFVVVFGFGWYSFAESLMENKAIQTVWICSSSCKNNRLSD